MGAFQFHKNVQFYSVASRGTACNLLLRISFLETCFALALKRERKKAIRSNNKKEAASDFIFSLGDQLPVSHWAHCE